MSFYDKFHSCFAGRKTVEKRPEQAFSRECHQWSELWPQRNQREFRPVTIGMLDWIKQHPETNVTAQDIKRVMTFVMAHRGYHGPVKVGATRLNLDTEPAGNVTEQEAEWARKEIDVIAEQRARVSAAHEA